ncbi:uncharacterized protein LOC119374402 [Rhipicephalus sanguineus]|uniref:uncharacterized protein LOC119374402 n=1 Tax=Rhipicephalus sanguineus TaxID=34632 RepID=UPI001893A326|nr:uncharacterized protein LOC119374402 [Rhipicephalus sanguineus]
MLKCTSLVLLGSAFVVSRRNDFFERCVKPEEEQVVGQCVMAPEHWLRSKTYQHYALEALEKGNIQPDEGNLNTLLAVTRAASQLWHGIVIRIEFTTVESVCNSSVAYSEQLCRPLKSEANGLCQARFRYYGHLKLEQATCVPIFSQRTIFRRFQKARSGLFSLAQNWRTAEALLNSTRAQ